MFDMVRFAKEHMPPGSSIINTSSVVAYQPIPGILDYVATKARAVSSHQVVLTQLTPLYLSTAYARLSICLTQSRNRRVCYANTQVCVCRRRSQGHAKCCCFC